MQIREIEEKDNPVIEQIIKQSLESFQLNIPGTAYYDPYLGELAQYYEQAARAKYWVAVNEQDVAVGGVGIGSFGNHDQVGELQKLYIASEAQGKGLAKEFMNIALTFAEKHYAYCYLETFEKLSTANRLYEKFGFKQLDAPLEGTEHSACDTWFIKELS